MKPLDIVRTPGGGIAMVTEVTERNEASITYFHGCNPKLEHNAWWPEGGADGLTVLDSFPRLLTDCIKHPFSSQRNPGDIFFPVAGVPR